MGGGGGGRRELGVAGREFLEKKLKSGLLRMYFQHSGAKVRVFEQDTDIIKLWLFMQ